MALGQAETDRVGALSILQANGVQLVEALTFIGLADRDGRAVGPVITVVAGAEDDSYVVFWREPDGAGIDVS